MPVVAAHVGIGVAEIAVGEIGGGGCGVGAVVEDEVLEGEDEAVEALVAEVALGVEG